MSSYTVYENPRPYIEGRKFFEDTKFLRISDGKQRQYPLEVMFYRGAYITDKSPKWYKTIDEAYASLT